MVPKLTFCIGRTVSDTGLRWMSLSILADQFTSRNRVPRHLEENGINMFSPDLYLCIFYLGNKIGNLL